jgi:hypothetical protein
MRAHKDPAAAQLADTEEHGGDQDVEGERHRIVPPPEHRRPPAERHV